jgi:hypothetical protein
MRITNLLVSIILVLPLSTLACSDPMPPVDADDGLGVESGAEDLGTGGPKLDVASDETGMAEAGDASDEIGCERVDLLFVIDNSGSMADEQTNLSNGVPNFISEIQTQLADAESYHVGVITSDAYEFNDGCNQEGALVVATGGNNSSDAACGPYADGYNFMTENDDLDVAFPCAALVGTEGEGDERPIQTMQAALSPGMNKPGGCNEGFLRDDALLVVVIISDEEDDHEIEVCTPNAFSGSSGEPAQWFADLVAAKGGVETNIVVLSLIGPPGPDPAPCPVFDKCEEGADGAEVAERVAFFTTMFTHGIVGRICEPSFGNFFSEVVGVISTACDNFVPVG